MNIQISDKQKINLLAIEFLEIYGNSYPSQKQISFVEKFLIKKSITDSDIKKIKMIAREFN